MAPSRVDSASDSPQRTRVSLVPGRQGASASLLDTRLCDRTQMAKLVWDFPAHILCCQPKSQVCGGQSKLSHNFATASGSN